MWIVGPSILRTRKKSFLRSNKRVCADSSCKAPVRMATTALSSILKRILVCLLPIRNATNPSRRIENLPPIGSTKIFQRARPAWKFLGQRRSVDQVWLIWTTSISPKTSPRCSNSSKCNSKRNRKRRLHDKPNNSKQGRKSWLMNKQQLMLLKRRRPKLKRWKRKSYWCNSRRRSKSCYSKRRWKNETRKRRLCKKRRRKLN